MALLVREVRRRPTAADRRRRQTPAFDAESTCSIDNITHRRITRFSLCNSFRREKVSSAYFGRESAALLARVGVVELHRTAPNQKTEKKKRCS